MWGVRTMNKSIRKDVAVRNESLLFIIASKNLGGHNCAHRPGSRAWNELVRHGIFLPMTLVGDRGINLRVVLNDNLTNEELSEAAAHYGSRLRLRDGCLALLGGSNYLDNCPDHELAEFLPVPKAEYRADVYSCFAGVNGPYLSEFQARELDESLGEWFRRTRPHSDFPRWLEDFCRAHPESDPGHERLWERPPAGEFAYQSEPEYLDFIVRLTRWDSRFTIEPPELDENGFIISTPLLPSDCPLGIVPAFEESTT
jgi:hypothetical protein